jgi:FixJ family two-component response regulator
MSKYPATKHVIAIVDDNPSVLRALKRVLDASKFITKTFDSGEALLGSGDAPGLTCAILDMHLGWHFWHRDASSFG